VASRIWCLTMRLSDAGLHPRQTKALYPNHRLPPWPTENATRDRSNRLLGTCAGPINANHAAGIHRLVTHILATSRLKQSTMTGTPSPSEMLIQNKTGLSTLLIWSPLRLVKEPSRRAVIEFRAEMTATRRTSIARKVANAPASMWCLTMRLSDAGLRRRPTKLIYANHRLPP
jgi:hypothetical protein